MNRQHTVLVVDDDQDIRDTLLELLEDNGYNGIGAADGREALDQLRATPQPPSVILLDLMMPVMDGWAFRAEQRNDPSLSGIPVVVISAYHDSASSTELDAADYLHKPLEVQDLLDVLQRHCPNG